MNYQPSTHVLILGAAIGLMTGVGLIIYMLTSFSLMPPAVEAEPVAVTVSENPIVESREETLYEVGELMSWQEEGVSKVTATASSPYSIDDLSHLDLGMNTPKREEFVPDLSGLPTVTTTTTIHRDEMSDGSIEDKASEEGASSTYGSIGDVSWESCGTLDIPSGFGLALFALTAPSEPAVICSGETIGNSCGSSIMNLASSGYVSGILYVSERPDGVCGIGVGLTDNLISLCDVEKVLDIGSGTDKTMSEWEKDFKADPGGSFATMYFNDTSAFEDLDSVTKYDCQFYEI